MIRGSGRGQSNGAACGRQNEELSGYLDGMLTQGDAQRVRLHLERCDRCRRLVEDMSQNRRAAMTTRFVPVSDDQFDETPRSLVSRVARDLGWGVLLVWLLVTLGLALWLPKDISEDTWTRVLLGGSLVGWGALFLSALLDRLKTMKGDIYRGVRK